MVWSPVGPGFSRCRSTLYCRLAWDGLETQPRTAQRTDRNRNDIHNHSNHAGRSDKTSFGRTSFSPPGPRRARDLEAGLNEPDHTVWDVWNIATSPAAIWYYANALIAAGRSVIERAGPDAEPPILVMSYLHWYDMEQFGLRFVHSGLSRSTVGERCRVRPPGSGPAPG